MPKLQRYQSRPHALALLGHHEMKHYCEMSVNVKRCLGERQRWLLAWKMINKKRVEKAIINVWSDVTWDSFIVVIYSSVECSAAVQKRGKWEAETLRGNILGGLLGKERVAVEYLVVGGTAVACRSYLLFFFFFWPQSFSKRLSLKISWSSTCD